MNKNILITLNKCFNTNKNNIKDKTQPFLELDLNTAKEIIKDANLQACRACNCSSNMWKDYYFKNRQEALCILENRKEEIQEIINKEVDKRLKGIKDKNKLNNKKYINKIKENTKKYIYTKELKNIEINIQKEDKERYGVSYCNIIQTDTKLIMRDYNTSNVGALDQQLVQNNWKRDKEKILNYEAKTPEYGKDTPFFFHNKNYILSNKDGYFVELSLFSKIGYEKYNLKNGTRLKFQIDKMDNNKKATINKIINGIYKQGSAQIRISKKNKIELLISYSFEAEEKELDKNRILGIDLGIVKVASMAIWDNNNQNWDYINYKCNVLSGQELIQFRQKLHSMGMTESEIKKEIQKCNEHLHQKQLNNFSVGLIDGIQIIKYRNTIDKHKKELSIASKWAGKGRIGHGYNNKMKPLDKIRSKASNFADTFNHKYSRYIIDFAIKNNCGIIQMENLTGATANTREKFLKDWAYYDLQTKIEYKAKEVGIEVIYINPNYTSMRCSKCGKIHHLNRNCKENQEKFECIKCGYKENADINASKNIAMPHIDTIIKETIEFYIKNNIDY